MPKKVYPLGTCSACGERPAATKGLCMRCYKRLWRQRKREAERNNAPIEGVRMDRDDAIQVVECPADPLLGRPLFRPGARFSRDDWRETLRYGVWPNGMRFEKDDVTLEVRGRRAVVVRGGE